MIWDGFIGLALSKPELVTALGTGPMRMYQRLLPQGLKVFPAATFRANGTQDHSDYDGASTLDEHFCDLHCYGRTYNEAEDLWWTLRGNLEQQSGTFNGVVIHKTFYMPSGVEDYLEKLELYTKQLEIKIITRR